MSVLPYWVVVFAGAEEGCLGIDVSLVEDGVDGDGEEVTECGDYSGIGVEDRFTAGVGCHGAESFFGACAQAL